MSVKTKVIYRIDELMKANSYHSEDKSEPKKSHPFKRAGSFMRIRKRKDLKSKPNN